MLDADARWPGHLAAVDIGSNSFRLEIGQLQQGRYRRIDYLKETVRLGAGLDADGLLTEDAARRGLACLAPLRAARCEGFAPSRCARWRRRRCARRATAMPSCARAQAVLGLPIEVISGPRGGAADLRRRRAPAAVRRAAAGGRHRRALDRDDPRPRPRAAACRVVPGRQRQPVDALLRRRPLQRATPSAPPRSPPAPSSRKRSSRSRRRTGARRSAPRARPARSSQLLAASGISDGRITPDGLRWLIEHCLARRPRRQARPARAEGRPRAPSSAAASRSSTRSRRTSASRRCSRRAARCARA